MLPVVADVKFLEKVELGQIKLGVVVCYMGEVELSQETSQRRVRRGTDDDRSARCKIGKAAREREWARRERCSLGR